MSKEFHVFTHQGDQYEQAFVFTVERNNDEGVEFQDLLMITQTPQGELRTVMKFDEMIHSIIRTNGGNVNDKGVCHIVDLFKDVISNEKQHELMADVYEKEIKNLDPNELIKANEYAIMMEQAEYEKDTKLT